MLSRDQLPILKKINRYLILQHRPIQLPLTGYCHGIALNWLDLMDENEEQLYYDFAEKIVSADDQELLKMESDIEFFLPRIELLQNYKDYIKNMGQKDAHRPLERPQNLSLSFLFNQHNLPLILQLIISDNDMVSITRQYSWHAHTIAVFKRNNQYHIFDSNYSSGKAKIINSPDDLAREIITCLFVRFGCPINFLPLRFSVSNKKEKNNQQLKQDLLKILLDYYSAPIDYTFGGINNLLLACAGKDVDTVKLLLKYSANPNQHWGAMGTPLTFSIVHSSFQIAKLLLEAKADPNYIDQQGNHPLSLACKNPNDSMIHNLLKAGANPCFLSPDRTTPLGVVLEMKNWTLVAKLLSFIQDPNAINSDNNYDLCQYKSFVLPAIEKLEKTASTACRNNLARVKKSIEQTPASAYQKNNLFSVTFPDWVEKAAVDDAITFGYSATR